MLFELRGQSIVLREDPSLTKALVSLKTMVKELLTEKEGMMVELFHLEGVKEDEEIDLGIEEVIKEFIDVFTNPKGSPPQRGHKHAFILKEGTELVNVHPYHYPHIQKNEIEKFVAEMLEVGVIRPSMSPFSSPVLLVRRMGVSAFV